LTLDERQSIGQKRTGRRAKQQPTGKSIVPQPERRNEIFPTTDEVGDCPSEEEGGDREEEEEPAEQGKGNWIRNSTLPFKGSTIAKPRPPRTGRKLKKHRTPNSCRIYGGAPSSTPPKIPRPNLLWFGSMSRGPRDPPEQGPLKETGNPVETERTNATAAEVNPPVPLPELPTRQSFKATSARMAREEARAKYVTKEKKELTITPNTMLRGLHRYGLHEFDGPASPLSTRSNSLQWHVKSTKK